MNIGNLNIRGRFERRATSLNATYGTPVDTWEIVDTRWIALQDVMPSRSEGTAQDMNLAKNPTRLRMRYCSDIDSTMRVIINRPSPTIYQIIGGPAILGDKDGLEFMIEKVSTDG
jgi:head-tail adaptor